MAWTLNHEETDKCKKLMQQFYSAAESVPRLKEPWEHENYPARKEISVRCGKLWGEKGVYVGKQVDPCPLKAVDHQRPWNDNTTVEHERDYKEVRCPHCKLPPKKTRPSK